MTITVNDLDSQIITINSTIPNGGSLSGIVDCMGFLPYALITPAAWTAAALSAQGSIDGVTFFPIGGSSGAQVALCSAVSPSFMQIIASVFSANFVGCFPRWLKLRSGTDAVPVNQGADRIFTIMLKPDADRKP